MAAPRLVRAADRITLLEPVAGPAEGPAEFVVLPAGSPGRIVERHGDGSVDADVMAADGSGLWRVPSLVPEQYRSGWPEGRLIFEVEEEGSNG